MCGICGVIEKNRDNQELVTRMCHTIEHRGPDSYRVVQHGDVCLGHRRLAIIDLATGDQPVYNEDKSLCVIFNGEIYNYLEIKTELLKNGHRFSTKSDTEVLIHAYEEWGVDFIQKLNGIFAFAILDKNREKMLLARDQFGIKPLHYYFKDGLFIFGSEQKSILLHKKITREINYKALHSHLNLRYTQRDETLFNEIKRLPPAHYMIFEKGNLEVKRYWQLRPDINYKMTENEAVDGINALLKQAVKRQLMSDVPLGVYLSGGMDSSTIVQKMVELGVSDINTFTMGFNEPTDEFPDAEMVAKHFGTKHHSLSLSMNPMQQFPEVIWHAEEPKINLLQGFNMSNFVRKNITVVLGGLGGDELFAGYDIHKFIYPFNKINAHFPDFLKRAFRWKSDFLFKVQNWSGSLRFDEYRRGLQMLCAIGDIEKFYLVLRNVWDFDAGFYRNVYHPDLYNHMQKEAEKVKTQFSEYFNTFNNLTALDNVLYTEFQTKMVNDYLLVEDRMSMANSIEERVPFLDIDLVNFSFSIPAHLKIRNNQTKYLFRKAMTGKLPKEIITKKKWGFSVNSYLQFKKDLKNVAEKILTREFVEKQGIFNYDYLRKIMDYPPHPRLRWHYNFLWIVMGIAIWEKMYIKTDLFEEKTVQLEAYYN